MKKSLSLISILFVLTAFTYHFRTEPSTLKKVAAKLDGLERVSYRFHLEINNATENYFSKDSSDCYFEFNQQTKFVSRFRAENESSIQIYNGTEPLYLKQKKKKHTR